MKEYNDNPPMIEQEKAFEIEDLLRYWQIIKLRLKLLIATFVIVMISGTIYTFNITPQYKATTTIIIEPDLPQMANIDSYSNRANTEEFFQTQLKIVNSRSVVEQTVNSLQRNINSYGIVDPEEEINQEGLIKGFMSRIEIETDKNTRLIELSISNTDPETATEEVNTLAQTYINYNLEDRRATSKDAFLWLSEQLAVLKKKVENSDMDLLKYKESENLVSLEKRQTLLEERIAETNESYAKATTNYMELKTMLTEIKALDNIEQAESLPRIIQNPLIQQLKTELSRLEIELAKVSKKYKSEHPQIKNLQSQIDNIKQGLHKEIEKTIKSIEIETKIYESNIQSIERSLSNLKQQSMSLAKQAIKYGVLKREAESNKNMYDVLLHRLKETDISGRVTANNIRVIDTALTPKAPVVPNKKLYLMATFILALGLGIGLSLGMEFFDNTIKSEDDIKLHLHDRIFGSIPFVKNIDQQDESSFNAFSRAYSEIKTNLRFYQKEHMLKTVMVTSAEQSEGKTTSVYNLGLNFAKTGHKVLIVDADLFKPRLGKMLKVENNKGVSDYLLNDENLDDLIVLTTQENLEILPAGLIPPSPAELIGSQSLRDMINELKAKYDIVLVDSPPINSTIEVSVLSSFIDGVILTIKAQNTTKPNLRKAVHHLESKNGNIIGTILTASKYSDKFSYYYYQNSDPKA